MGCVGQILKNLYAVTIVVVFSFFALHSCYGASLDLLGQETIQAGGQDLLVSGYSVPISCDWNNDGRKDLIIGEKPSSSTGKIRVYLNTGIDDDPVFGSYSYVQSNGTDLVLNAEGCLGAAPCIVYWNELGKKDLLVGTAFGEIWIYHNTGNDTSPTFDGGTFLFRIPNTGKRAMPVWTDWNDDGKEDLIAGSLEGKIWLYINTGTNTAPNFSAPVAIQCGGADLIVPSQRSAPAICDFDEDGKKDMLTGNTSGQLLFYKNFGTDQNPSFSSYGLFYSTGIAIGFSQPASPRTRPFVCDWDDDGSCDIIVGLGDGKVHLFRGTFPGDLDYNKKIDMHDFAIFSGQWQSSGDLVGDISPPEGDSLVNVFDLAVFAQNWLGGL